MSVLPVGFAGGRGAYEIPKSLRFRSSASAFLARTPGSTGNRKTWTWSGWHKRGAANTYQIFSAENGTGNFTVLALGAADNLEVFNSVSGLGGSSFATSAVFRDPGAWYHIFLAVDTTQATLTNRARIWVNGVLQTWGVNGSTAWDQNRDTWVNAAVLHRQGKTTLFGGIFLDGYLSEIHFIDGQALDPTSFGEIDAVTGVWVPKAYTGTYGTNGFYLPFSNGTSLSTLTADASGNGNNWTANNISLTAGATYDWMEDTPTNNWCVLNPLKLTNTGSAPTFSTGNLRVSATDGRAWSSFVIPSGKWYWEVFIENRTSGNTITLGINDGNGNFCLFTADNDSSIISSFSATQSSLGGTANSQIIGVAFDYAAQTIAFYRNNVQVGTTISGVPANLEFYADVRHSSNNEISVFNFGQRPFAYTPPTGFLPLNTQNVVPITPISSGLFTGNANVNGPFVWLAGTPDSMTINGNAVTFGTHADRLANGVKLRTNSASYNAAGSNTFSVSSFVDDFTDPNRAKGNP